MSSSGGMCVSICYTILLLRLRRTTSSFKDTHCTPKSHPSLLFTSIFSEYYQAPTQFHRLVLQTKQLSY